MTVTSHARVGTLSDDRLAGYRPDESRIDVGSFQVIVCAACGYTEWYAYNIERIKDIPGARLVGPNPGDGGPYR